MLARTLTQSNRPKSVRISEEDDEMRYFEHERVNLVNRENQHGFLVQQGRCGLRFPTPSSLDSEDANSRALFRHSYPAYLPLAHANKRQTGQPQEMQARADCSRDLDDCAASLLVADTCNYSAHALRSHTPTRMGFAGDAVVRGPHEPNLSDATCACAYCSPRLVGYYIRARTRLRAALSSVDC